MTQSIRCAEDLLAAHHLLAEDELAAAEVEALSSAVDKDFEEYDLHPELCCSFHLKIKNPNCAVARLRKILYVPPPLIQCVTLRFVITLTKPVQT